MLSSLTIRHMLFTAVLLLSQQMALAQPATEFSTIEKQLGSDKFTVVAPFPPGGPVDLLARLPSKTFRVPQAISALNG
jgi:tripartite-type tricarboxylate transporter receptor subunit TctC